MNFLRLSGSWFFETCSAETVVPRMTNRSTPAATTVSYSSCVRCGESAPATMTPAARISASRAVTRSGLIGSAYSCCMRAVACSGVRLRISASTGSGSSYLVQRPSRSSTPRPPSWPIMMAVRGETTESIGAARNGMSNWYASIDQLIETSSGSRVRRLGTMAMSSNA